MTTVTSPKLVLVSAAGGETVKNSGGTTLVTLATGDLVLVASMTAPTTVPMASQQNTVGYRNTNYPSWFRYIEASNVGVAIKRAGSSGVMWLHAVIAAASSIISKNMSWTPPVIATQPANVSVAHTGGGGASASFAASFASELLSSTGQLSYVWSELIGSTWTAITPGSGAFTSGYAVVNTVETNGLVTSTLTVSGLTTTGKTGYKYRCAATDYATSPGTVTSTPATLTVT